MQEQEPQAKFQALVEAGAAFRGRILAMVLADPEHAPTRMAMVFGMVELMVLLKPQKAELDTWIDKLCELVEHYGDAFSPEPPELPQ